MMKICSDMEERQDMRIVIVGHVDHGKSTVIGRLLADTGSLPLGKLEQIREKCRRTAKPFEYAFLLDALKDEQAQGVTIDSARCFFKTEKRNYIIIDAPGHTEFIKNMVSGASRAEAALLVIDGLDGIQENSKRHGLYLSLLGIEQICVLVNKMDLVDYKEERFRDIAEEYTAYLRQIHVVPKSFIPISGFQGDNIAALSENMKWYKGNTLLETLDGFQNEELPIGRPFRMPVQDVYKFTENGDQRRIIAGTIESGRLHVGDAVAFYPSLKKSRVKTIECFPDGILESASAGMAAGFTLEDQIYIRRGELAAIEGESLPRIGRRVKANLFWLGKQPLKEGNKYLFKIGSIKTGVTVETIHYVMDGTDAGFTKKKQIERHEVGECDLRLEKDIAFDISEELIASARFVLVDDYNIAGGGTILAELKPEIEERNLFYSGGKVSYEERCESLGQQGLVLWFTGLSGAGKSTIAIEVERELVNRGKYAYRLDGDNIRDGLNSDLGFTIHEREENIRRITEVANLFYDSGMVTLVSFISPLRSMRERARTVIGENGFVEVYVKASLETCMKRDVKGLYSKAVEGKIKDFTGISSRYEEPDCPDLILDTESLSIRACVDMVLNYLQEHYFI